MNNTTTTTKKSATPDTIAARAIMGMLAAIGDDEEALTLATGYISGGDDAIRQRVEAAMAAITAEREERAAKREERAAKGIAIPNPLADGTITVHAEGERAAILYDIAKAEVWADKPSEKADAKACLAWLRYTGDKAMPWEVASAADMAADMIAAGADEDEARKHCATVRNGIAARIRKLMAQRERGAAMARDAKTMRIGADVKARGGATFARISTYGRAK